MSEGSHKGQSENLHMALLVPYEIQANLSIGCIQ